MQNIDLKKPYVLFFLLAELSKNRTILRFALIIVRENELNEKYFNLKSLSISFFTKSLL